MNRAYKWMRRRDGQLVTPIQSKLWPVAVGEWTAKESPVICESGWHAMEEKDVLSHLPNDPGAELWWVEYRGAVATGVDKLAAAQMRLLELVGVTTWENLRLFACDVAEDVLPFFERVFPADKRPRETIAVARRFTQGEVSWSDLAAAWDAAWGAWAARAAAGDAAGDAAGAAARDAAWAARAAWAAAGDAAGCAAWARYSNWLVVRLESGY